jgi:EAL domain-containing protein (putative c-di-GMP-specific phosphodiesterase class I)
VVRIDNHRIMGAEALARWHHPRWGHVPPDKFIAVAERLGLMSGLTSHVLGVACAQVAAWKMEGRVADDFRVAVNLSADDLAGPGLVDVVRGALDGSGLDAGSLTVEVTETGLVRDTGTALAVLKAIRRLGARIAIDDFGTGYSSLSYLKMFPVDVVKIDKSFVFGLGRDAEATALVRGILSLTRALGLTAVAEGIENDVQLEALRQLGCPLAQGYFFSRPVPADQFPSTLSIAPAPDGDALLAQAQLAPVVADGGADLGWAVLDALPTAVAVVGPDGIILATNLAWKRFALDNGANASSCGVGVDYLAVCENARGVGAEDASLAARGLRAVLAGDRDAFTLEYDCDSPIQRRRFLMTASPVASGAGCGRRGSLGHHGEPCRRAGLGRERGAVPQYLRTSPARDFPARRRRTGHRRQPGPVPDPRPLARGFTRGPAQRPLR